MSLFGHAVTASIFLILAGGGAFLAGPHLPGLGPDAAIGMVAWAVLAAAVAWEVTLRMRRERQFRGELESLRERNGQLARDLKVARNSLVEIRNVLAEGLSAGQRVRQIAAEVEVLQKLVEQLWVQRARIIGPGEEAGSTDGEASAALGNLDDAQMLDLVREAVAMGRVDLYLQPIVTLPQRRHQLYECFTRIRDARGRIITPERYIRVAEEEGLVAAIDNVLLFRCVQLIRRARHKNPAVGFVCNVSRHSLVDRDFLRDFADFIETNADLAPSLVFEFGQDDFDFADVELTAYLDGLAALGMRFSLDKVRDLALDAAELAARRFRFVKVDASLYRSVDRATDSALRALRRDLARHGIQLVVEKVESEVELLELLEFDVTLGQGYLFGPPKIGPEV
jgi:cyclic-di-GMP phosphodiesterase, flagellum assembly factor TipF